MLSPIIMGNITPITIEYPNAEIERYIKELGNGNEDAFENLYLMTERILYSYTLSIVKNHEDALDIIHDTYLKVKASAHLYKPMGKPLAWMFTIAKNLSKNMFVKKNRHTDLPEYYEESIEFSYVSDPIDKLVLESAFKILSEEELKIVLLYVVNGLKHREIAKDLNLSIGTVTSKYNRALKKLRSHLEEL